VFVIERVLQGRAMVSSLRGRKIGEEEEGLKRRRSLRGGGT
jgi:hypothetical protein